MSVLTWLLRRPAWLGNGTGLVYKLHRYQHLVACPLMSSLPPFLTEALRTTSPRLCPGRVPPPPTTPSHVQACAVLRAAPDVLLHLTICSNLPLRTC